MDKELLKEREKFKKQFMTVHTDAPKAKRPSDSSSHSASKKEKISEKEKVAKSSASQKLNLAQLKQMGGGSQFKFGVLTKIVRHMRARHMDGEDQALTLEEILDETHQLDVDSKTKYWLSTEALKSNPKISAAPGMGGQTTYLFKPPYNIQTKKALMKLLKQYSIKGKGGILLEDLQESLPKCDSIIKKLEDNGDIWLVNRPADKKKIVFFHDDSDDFEVHEDFVKLWRSVTVDGKDDINIDDYLTKNGIKSMQDQGMGKVSQLKRKPIKRNFKRKNKLKDNLHIAQDLEDYSEMTASSFTKSK